MALLQTKPMLASTPAFAGNDLKGDIIMAFFLVPAILITALFGGWSLNERHA
jgi:hypothetical protein